MRKLVKLICMAGLGLISMTAFGQNWSMKKAVLMTSYSSKIDTANVLGEYPRPQMVRENWMNLNGIWQYQPGVSAQDVFPIGKLSSKILVPFAVESAISGVMEAHDRLWYRRSFTVPTAWSNQKILLHFGAVDYESEVFINGHSLGVHKGGYDPFTYDISTFITGSGPQELTVRVFDPTDNGGQPRGKQTLKPEGIMYTCVTGIWQTVWLEPIPQTSISNIKIVPDIDKSVVNLKVNTQGAAANQTVTVAVKDGATVVSTFTGAANSNLVIPVPNAKLWSPNSPFLYDLDIKLSSNATGLDSLKSYFGMRKVSLEKVGPYQKMMLNNEFVFHMGPLDQGFWPDGLYTAPTDVALKYDIERTKSFGYNMVRKHIKVEPYRWYYWADKLGLMVWQDMPSCNSYWTTDARPEIDKVQYQKELVNMVENHWNSPSIVMWVVFNEFQGQHDVKPLCDQVMAMDSTRFVNQGSGGPWDNAGTIYDIHNYPPPAAPANKGVQALVCGEYGGIGLKIEGHIWKEAPTYVFVPNATALINMYDEFADKLVTFKSNMGLSGAVYTEITDVESELNGLMTYDRLLKCSVSAIRNSNLKIINNQLLLSAIAPAAPTSQRLWSYTTTQPAANWYTKNFNASSWTRSLGGFGSKDMALAKTIWDTDHIWLRRTFECPGLSQANVDSLKLWVQHDEDCEIYINGVLAANLSGYNTSYSLVDLSPESKLALVQGGENVMAIHCHQTIGGQYIDAGLYVLSYGDKTPLAIEDTEAKTNIKLYPNPVVNELILSGLDNKEVRVGIYNTYGVQLVSQKGCISSMDVSELSSGVYLLKIEGEQISQVFKFTKK